MTKNIIYLVIAGAAVYFLFFYKKDKTTTTTTPATTPTGGSTTGGGGTNTGTTTGPPYAIGETRLRLKSGASSYYVDTANKDYTNTDIAPVFLGGKVVRRGSVNGINGYILSFATPNGTVERAFYESDLII